MVKPRRQPRLASPHFTSPRLASSSASPCPATPCFSSPSLYREPRLVPETSLTIQVSYVSSIRGYSWWIEASIQVGAPCAIDNRIESSRYPFYRHAQDVTDIFLTPVASSSASRRQECRVKLSSSVSFQFSRLYVHLNKSENFNVIIYQSGKHCGTYLKLNEKLRDSVTYFSSPVASSQAYYLWSLAITQELPKYLDVIHVIIDDNSYSR